MSIVEIWVQVLANTLVKSVMERPTRRVIGHFGASIGTRATAVCRVGEQIIHTIEPTVSEMSLPSLGG